jgi:hypothetical protein
VRCRGCGAEASSWETVCARCGRTLPEHSARVRTEIVLVALVVVAIVGAMFAGALWLVGAGKSGTAAAPVGARSATAGSGGATSHSPSPAGAAARSASTGAPTAPAFGGAAAESWSDWCAHTDVVTLTTLAVGRPGNAAQALITQQILATLGYPPGPVDGQFGPRTASAVSAFQQAQGLPPTGIVDRPTWTQLKARFCR